MLITERAAYGCFTLRDLEGSGFPEAGGPITRLIRLDLELEPARMHAGPWMREYLPQVKAGELRIGIETDLRVL